MAFSGTYFPFGGAIGALTGSQSGRLVNIPADGSATTLVSFATPYATSVASIVVAFNDGATPKNYGYFHSITAVANASFKLTVWGGPPGSTVTVYYLAIGN